MYIYSCIYILIYIYICNCANPSGIIEFVLQLVVLQLVCADMRLEFSEWDSESGMEMFSSQLETISDTFIRKLYSGDWKQVSIPNFGIGFGKLHCHVCENAL